MVLWIKGNNPPKPVFSFDSVSAKNPVGSHGY